MDGVGGDQKLKGGRDRLLNFPLKLNRTNHSLSRNSSNERLTRTSDR